MKKIFLLVLVVMGALFSYGQSADRIEKVQIKEMDALINIVTYSNKNLTFNKNQTAKLDRLLFKKAKELATLRVGEHSKSEYVEGYRSIVDKYEPLVMALLTVPQRIEYKKNRNKPIKKMKDF